jgi:hypothetical protein
MKAHVFVHFLRHCEERSDAAIHVSAGALPLDCRAALAMTASREASRRESFSSATRGNREGCRSGATEHDCRVAALFSMTAKESRRIWFLSKPVAPRSPWRCGFAKASVTGLGIGVAGATAGDATAADPLAPGALTRYQPIAVATPQTAVTP